MLNKGALIDSLIRPLAISRGGLRALLVGAVNGEAGPLPKGFEYVDDETEKRSSVAVIDIDGPLSKDPDIWQLFFGGTSYADIKNKLDCALLDESVSSIVLNVNSPGGAVYGCSELAGHIYAAREKKPIYAYISGQGDSAAYWLSAAADEVVINATAEAGSIGVRSALVDDSEFLASLGVKYYDIVADQSPLKVVDASKEEDRARVKAQMTDFATVFVADVAKCRNVSVQKVLSDFGRGDVLVGQAAVDAGLADRVGTLDGLIAELSANANNNEDFLMRIQKTNAAAAAAAPAAPTAGVSNGKCSKCRADMDDGDPMYCKACMMDEDGDDDAKKSKAFRASVLALLNETDADKAIGSITGYKAQAEQATAKLAEIESQLAAARKEKADADVKALLDAACQDGRVTPAAREKFEKLYADHGVGALDAALSVLTPAQSAAVPATEDKAAEAAKAAAAVAPKTPAQRVTAALTDEQIRIIKATGSTPEKYLEHRAKLFANLPIEEK